MGGKSPLRPMAGSDFDRRDHLHGSNCSRWKTWPANRRNLLGERWLILKNLKEVQLLPLTNNRDLDETWEPTENRGLFVSFACFFIMSVFVVLIWPPMVPLWRTPQRQMLPTSSCWLRLGPWRVPVSSLRFWALMIEWWSHSINFLSTHSLTHSFHFLGLLLHVVCLEQVPCCDSRKKINEF